MATELSLKEKLVSASGGIEASGVVAYAGFFERGGVNQFLEINTVADLESIMGKPTEDTINDFLECYDYLQYGNNLILQRIVPKNARLARRGLDSSGVSQSIDLWDTGDDGSSYDTYEDNPHFFFEYQERNTTDIVYPLEFWTKAPFDSSNTSNPVIKVYVAKYTGSDWQSDLDSDNAGSGQTLAIGNTGSDFSDLFEVGTVEENGDGDTVNELAIVITEDGEIVETHLVSTVDGVKNAQGANYYISEWLDRNSDYIWGYTIADDYSDIPDVADGNSIMEVTLSDGSKGSAVTTADVLEAYNRFDSKNEIFYDYMIDGFHAGARTNIEARCGDRKDSICFLSPIVTSMFTGAGTGYYPSKNMFPIRNSSTIVTNLIADKAAILTGDDDVKSRSAYYGNWKQVYNKYMDDYRWIPISASVAGVKVQVNQNANVWDVPAGDRGILRNTEKLAFEPTPTQQQTLYKNAINDIFFDITLGFKIDGSKTLIATSKNVGVGRVSGREIFRVIENYVVEVSKLFYHKFNNSFTRSRFVSMIDPVLDRIQNEGGIVRYSIEVGDDVNTTAVINNYEFKAVIYLEVGRPIEKISLVFVDTPAGISFSELSA